MNSPKTSSLVVSALHPSSRHCKVGALQDKPYKEKSKSKERKKDFSEQRRKKREFE